MNCAVCNCTTNDGVQCSVCKNQLCYSCGGITESGYRRLGSDRRAAWKCPQCKIPSISIPSPKRPISPTTEPAKGSSTPVLEAASMELVLAEIRDMKRQISALCTVVDEFKEFKKELADLRSSCEYTSEKLDEYDSKFKFVEQKITDMASIHEVVASVQNTITELTAEAEITEQRMRLSNIEIRGVPLKKEENLYAVVESIGTTIGYQIQKSQLNYIARVPTYSKDKNLVVSFINRYVKEDFIAAARVYKELKASDIGFKSNNQRVFVNDHLTPASKNLLNKAKKKAMDRNYSYKWVKYGKIHIRKNDSSPVIVINKESDLNKIV